MEEGVRKYFILLCLVPVLVWAFFKYGDFFGDKKPPPKGVQFSQDIDKPVRAYVRRNENDPVRYYYPIERKELVGIKQMQLPRLLAVTVNGMEAFPDLEKLDLSDNSILDIKNLSTCPVLQELLLDKNKLVDITPLGNISTLKTLTLTQNKITDISGLARLSNEHLKEIPPCLEILKLDDNAVSDLSPIAKLTTLKVLEICNNQVTDITPLAKLVNLQILKLSGNQIRDISAIQQMPKLIWLSLENNKITDITPIARNTALGKSTEIYLQGNPIDIPSQKENFLAIKGRGSKVTFFKK
ncbi:MAG: leucine-rich repeat domain-containing protein [Candidatus Wallbacteria bacterium]|nr:leucine-rich repeat domain-containing protein [Candidatus Wallbacteria bacterium]